MEGEDHFEPEIAWNYEGPRIFLSCATCGGAGDFVDPAAFPGSPIVSSTCSRCGRMLTAIVALVPPHLSPQSERTSPDGSAFAYWVPSGLSGRVHAKSLPPKKLPNAKLDEPDDVSSLDSKVERLRTLREYTRLREEEFKDDPILLQAFKRMADREKRKIMGNPEEDNS